ncbi:MAG: hypothetical protein ACOYXC_00475 [Candidatus Rifleibacteriota bacterium]
MAIIKRFNLIGLIFFLLASSFCSGALSASQVELSAIVLTFDPPIISGINYTEALYSRMKNLAGNKTGSDNLAAVIGSLGATWMLSRNLSGIQLALIFPDKNDQLPTIIEKYIEQLGSNLNETPLIAGPISFAQHLTARDQQSFIANGRERISLYTYGISLDKFYNIKNLLEKLDFLYPASATTKTSERWVLKDSFPAVVKILNWNEISASSFFSAKYLGENFLRNNGDSEKIEYEIIFEPGMLKLFLIAKGSEEELFLQYPRIEEFYSKISEAGKSSDWATYSRTAGQILIDDNRDLTKSLQQKAWFKHWQSSFNESEINFVIPEDSGLLVNMPSADRHFFSRTGSQFPRIVAILNEDGKNISDIAIRMAAEPRIIDEIVKTFDTDQTLSFPLSMNRESEQYLLIQFHAANENVSRSIAGIRSRILNHLALKNLVNELPSELSVSIAASSSVPPFLLRGWLQLGWPADPANYAWQPASIEDLYELLDISGDDKSAFMRKWLLKTATGRDKAELLARLASRGLFIESFDPQ